MDPKLVADALLGKNRIRCVRGGNRYQFWAQCGKCGHETQLTSGERSALRLFCLKCNRETVLMKWQKSDGVYDFCKTDVDRIRARGERWDDKPRPI